MKKALKTMVEECLRNIPETRNSDIALMVAVWRRYYPQKIRRGSSGEEGVWIKDLYELPREDNVMRVRRKLNSEGKYFPTDWKIAKARGIKEDEWRRELGYPSKANTARPTQGDSYMDEQRSFKNPDLFNGN